ncbi:Putative binding protein HI_1525 precursor [uncultured Clostridium sp.]|uniref:molybdate ABC transporter substrate-binding protein n=1 Tax=uncultured Clostridium sp. TaxID=59620 RepID=UPI000821F50A|nr:molybdate ABC transporter substrate-binding protein [uncultured Clostridium sp.]SCK04607.1 Putative binding protein HI_1525 precursor [uncultured Clostridium sp.]
MKKKIVLAFVLAIFTVLLITGCSVSKDKEVNEEKKILSIYCGAGMRKPFEEIVSKFETENKCDVNVTYANAAQIQTQINTSKEGDLFVAGSQDELKPIEEVVSDRKDLVKHIPVLAVQKGNPKNIKGLNDLTNEDIKVVLGDYESTPIGKIAKKSLSDASIFEKVNIIANTATAPELINALSSGECDAVIVWKENTENPNIEIVETTDLDKYIKTVPVATLNCSENTETVKLFLDFLDTDSAKSIWANYGYEILN